MPITAEDFSLVRILRQKEVLESITLQQAAAAEGAIVAYCGDCDQVHDLGPQQRALFSNGNSHPRVHDVALNGGALLLAPDSPLHAGLPQDRVMAASIIGAYRIKTLPTAVLIGHCPCGAADLVGLSFQDILEELFKAKTHLHRILKAEGVVLELICFVHIDYGKFMDGKRRTYYIGRKKWEAYKRSLL